MARRKPIYVCGGAYHLLDAREVCPNPLHDWPLPSGYVEASEMADSRLSQGWSNVRCPDCDLYGWVQGRMGGVAGESRRVTVGGEA